MYLSFQFWAILSSKCQVPDPTLFGRVGLLLLVEVLGVVQVVQNWLTEIRIRPKFEVRMKSLGVYRMSKDGVYLSSVPFLSFLGYIEFEVTRSRSNFVWSSWPIVVL